MMDLANGQVNVIGRGIRGTPVTTTEARTPDRKTTIVAGVFFAGNGYNPNIYLI